MAGNPGLKADLDDLRLVGELFGHVAPEEVSESLSRRLYALDTVAPVQGFRVLAGSPPSRWPSLATWAASLAAAILIALGVAKLLARPDVVLKDLARVTVAADGTMADVNRLAEVTLKGGETVRAGPSERVSFRTTRGDRVTILPGGSLSLGDPSEGEVFELEQGTVLCSLLARDGPQVVLAGPYRVLVSDEAHFGIRLGGSEIRPAGAAEGGAEMAVTVSLGSVEVVRNGDRERVGAFERAVFRRGRGARGPAAADPVLGDLMRSYRALSREILPGYFAAEPGVEPIAQRWVGQKDGSIVLVVSDIGEAGMRSSHLVLRVRTSEPQSLRLTRVRPVPGGAGEAEAATVMTPPVGRDWTVIAVPRAAFDAATAERATRRVGADASRFVRFEIAPASPGARVEVQGSLWAARPPADLPEVVR